MTPYASMRLHRAFIIFEGGQDEQGVIQNL